LVVEGSLEVGRRSMTSAGLTIDDGKLYAAPARLSRTPSAWSRMRLTRV